MIRTFCQTMQVCLRILLLTLSLALGSCAPSPPTPPLAPEPVPRAVPTPLRGEFMILTPAQTQRQSACDSLQQRTMFRIDDMHVVPERIKAGEEVNQVVYYTFCSPSELVILQGRISLVVTFRGKEVFRDVTSNIDFKPGVWAVGAIIGIPKGAKSGAYTLDTTISYQDKNIGKRKIFYVDAPSGRR